MILICKIKIKVSTSGISETLIYRMNGVLKLPSWKFMFGMDEEAKPYQNANTDNVIEDKRANTNNMFHSLKLSNKIIDFGHWKTLID